MSPEPQSVSQVIPEEDFGSLRACLVEGNAEQCARERRVRRRALVTSILVQSAVLTLLFLVPLFGKTERIVMKGDFVPIPPYGHQSNHPRGNGKPTNHRPTTPDLRFTFHPPKNPANPHPVEQAGPVGPLLEYDPTMNAQNDGPDCLGCVNIGGRQTGPRPPQPAVETRTRPQLIHTQLDPAMLIRRIEPVYPSLAIQTHREGRVELRAIIGTDGTIQSLQVVSGDPLFLISAREAVQQWKYKPTILNGQAVEIDTFITVVYTMQH